MPEPLGVALVIAPWNYPIQLLVEPIGGGAGGGQLRARQALRAGARLLGRAGPPAPAVRRPRGASIVVEGGVEETTALLAERWDHIFFTGSTAVGRIVAEAAAKHLTPTVLELGGKSPTYVHASADLDVAARRIAWGKFLNAGQTCIAPDYVLVDHEVKDALVDKLTKQVRAFYGADPQASTSFGRIVNDRHVERLQRPPRRTGAGTVAAGGQVDAAERFVAPTITVEPAPDSAVMQEEIFGPILPVLGVDGPAEAKAFIGRPPEAARALRVRAARTTSSTTWSTTRRAAACA